MALRIHQRLKPYTPPAPPPEPLYAALIKSSLKPFHPLFDFQLLRLDTSTTVDFTVGFRDLLVEGEDLNQVLGKPQLLGTFPGLFFDRVQAQALQTGVADSYRKFEEYLFKVVMRFLSDVVHQDTREKRERMQLIQNGLIDWDAVIDYLNQATYRLRAFQRGVRREGDELDFFLMPLPWQIRLSSGLLQNEREPLAMNVTQMDKAEQQTQIDELMKAHSAEHVNYLLKQHLLKLLTVSLYHLTWVDA